MGGARKPSTKWAKILFTDFQFPLPDFSLQGLFLGVEFMGMSQQV